MMQRVLTISVLAITSLSGDWSGKINAQDRLPQFRDYPVTEVYRGKTALLILTRKDRMYRTMLSDAAKTQKPNFAGHYILTYWGCGSTCVMGAVIDAKTGRVYWWNFTVCCWPVEIEEPINVKLNSLLIVFTGARNEQEKDVGTHFYKFQNGRFIHIRSVLKQ
ncbi:MAG TPA: hypothetical protein VIG25_00790 [Pyrinomonadaceae bacterium]|jgi:hypothetical protein